MTLHPIPSKFPYIRGKFSFLFYQCSMRVLGLNNNELIMCAANGCHEPGYKNVRLMLMAKEWHRYTTPLQRKSHLCIPFLWIARPQSQFTHSCVCVRFIYSQDRSTYFPAAEWIGRSIMGIYQSLTDTWMWKLRLWPRNSFSGNICFEFSALILCSAPALEELQTENIRGQKIIITKLWAQSCNRTEQLTACSNKILSPFTVEQLA